MLFANFAEALAEGRGKAQAESLKKSRKEVTPGCWSNGKESNVLLAGRLKKAMLSVCETNDIIPADGEVIEGIASVDESAITGESAPVIRESGGDRSAVTGGTKVISDRIVIRITADPGGNFIDRMIALIEGAKRQRTPNEIALSIVLSGLTIIFLLAVVTLKLFADYSALRLARTSRRSSRCLFLYRCWYALSPPRSADCSSAIGIAGMDRLDKTACDCKKRQGG